MCDARPRDPSAYVFVKQNLGLAKAKGAATGLLANNQVIVVACNGGKVGMINQKQYRAQKKKKKKKKKTRLYRNN